MTALDLFSEPYRSTGGLAAEGVLNQLGRPDVEPLEVLVREAVQNCWDAKVADRVRVDIGRTTLSGERLRAYRQMFGPPPPGLPLGEQLVEGERILHFADFGTHGLGGPTRADLPGDPRDFVDFVLNVGQPPDKVFGGGSFGYGKAAFYLASKARTVIIDTLCRTGANTLERRLTACGLGANFTVQGRPYTGRHWWGRTVGGEPGPLTGRDAEVAARILGLPSRGSSIEMGTTVAVIAPGIGPTAADGTDRTIDFLADAVVWNFWPRMIDTPGSTRRTLEFTLTDDGRRMRIPDPRTHPRLRGFVEAMDRMRYDSGPDDHLVLDRSIESKRPSRALGRLVIAKGPTAPAEPPIGAAATHGARMTAAGVHHVALMRIAEIVVRYLPGEVPANSRMGYSGVFRCVHDLDEAFKQSEPPAHDDWIPRSVIDKTNRSYVTVALRRILDVCREAAGYSSITAVPANSDDLALGEFADALATLMPGAEGPGARRTAPRSSSAPRPRRHVPGRHPEEVTPQDWDESEARNHVDIPSRPSSEDGTGPIGGGTESGATRTEGVPGAPPVRLRPPQTRSAGDPEPQITPEGLPVISYPFEVRGRGNRIRLSAAVEVMTNDGIQMEADAPIGEPTPRLHAWIDPEGRRHIEQVVELGPEGVDGSWALQVLLTSEVMMRVNIDAESV